MNTLNEFIFITAGITVAFTILIIGLIRTNSKSKKQFKKAVFDRDNEFQYAEIMKKSAEELKKENEKLNVTLKFKDNLIHGYKSDIDLKNKKINDVTNEFIESNKIVFEQEDDIKKLEIDQKKLKEAIEYLEELNGNSMKQVAELNQENDKLKQHCQLISEDLVRNANGMKIARSIDEENQRLNKLIDECAIYIMNNCK